MHENYYDDRYEKFMCTGPIVKPNRITGEGRMKCRGSQYKNKAKDLEKKEHRKMAKKSRRQNRRG